MLITFKEIVPFTFKSFTSVLYYAKRNAQKCSKTSTLKGPPWKILFFGTDSFSLQSLKALCAKLRTGTLISSLGVVTKKSTPVYKFGEMEKLPLYYWPLNASEIQGMYDLGMVVSFGNLITKNIINAIPLGCINVHASLLPRWRGAAPVIHAILAGDNETGVTIMRIHPHKFDVGEIIRQYRVPIRLDETAEELERRLSNYGSQLLMECLRDLPKSVQMAVPQPNEGITFAPKIDQSLSHIDWEKSSAQSVFNMYRGLAHLYPLKTNWHGLIVKLRSIRLDKEKEKLLPEPSLNSVDSQKSALDFLLNSPTTVNEFKKNIVIASVDAGKCLYNKENKLLKVVCADGQNIIVDKLQVANKIMNGTDFYNGFLSKRQKEEWKFSKINTV